MTNGPCWVLLADGGRARVLEETVRGAALVAIAEWTPASLGVAVAAPRDRPPRVFESAASARHGMEGHSTPHERQEKAFLEAVAEKVAQAGEAAAFTSLVLLAPPRALGVLRAALPKRAVWRVEASGDKDVVGESQEAVRRRLHDLRAPR